MARTTKKVEEEFPSDIKKLKELETTYRSAISENLNLVKKKLDDLKKDKGPDSPNFVKEMGIILKIQKKGSRLMDNLYKVEQKIKEL